MFTKLSLLFAMLLSVFTQAFSGTELADRFKTASTKIFKLRMEKVSDLKKIQYSVPWGISYDLDSYLYAYEATKDDIYLNMFVKLAEKAVQARADKLGLKDWKGRLRKGWLSDEKYLTGGPFIIPDKNGKPSLEIRTTLLAYNTSTLLEIIPDKKDNSFTIITSNTKRRIPNGKSKFENLNMDNVENTFSTPFKRSVIRVKKVGDNIPAAKSTFSVPVYNTVLHGHHTGKAVIPLVWFYLIIKNDPSLKKKYGKAAEEFLEAAKESMDDMNSDWREHKDGGYIVFESGMPFWCDGVAEPNNTLALSGLAYLYLFKATGNSQYKERARKLASFMKKELEIQKDGTVNFFYWSRINRRGWSESAGCTNTPSYKMNPKRQEDTSHLQHSLRFFIECYRNKIVFSKEDMLRLALTFHKRIDLTGSGGSVADYFDGEGKSGRFKKFQMGWAEFYDVAPEVSGKIREIFESQDINKAPSSSLATWAVLLRAEALKK